jgi:phosphopantetheinyl transferase (holo-ACP synthase)
VKSAGNDIVALNAIDIQRTISPAFYSKFIIPEELELYGQPQFAAVPFQNFVWLLWSVKESAYKYLQRHQADLIFSPAKFNIQNVTVPKEKIITQTAVWESDTVDEQFYTGEVTFGTYQLYFRSKCTPQFIASVANHDPGFDNVYWGVNTIELPDHENQSKQVREFLLTKLISVLSTDDLYIGKSLSGYPIVIHGEKQSGVLVSLAHHDRFVAYSFFKA